MSSITDFFVDSSYGVPAFGAVVIGGACVLSCLIRLCYFHAHKGPKPGKEAGCWHHSRKNNDEETGLQGGEDVDPNGDGASETQLVANPGAEKDTGDLSEAEGHWREVHDRQGRTFYFNHKTGESRWTDPLSGSTNHQGEDLPPDWEAIHDEKTEKHYYYNSKTGESTWTKPTHGAPVDDPED
jgi:hypothetical protein